MPRQRWLRAVRVLLWLLAAVAVAGLAVLLVLAVWKLPGVLAGPEPVPPQPAPPSAPGAGAVKDSEITAFATRYAAYRNEISTTRTGILAGLAGLAALGSLTVTASTYRLSLQGQKHTIIDATERRVTELYTNAADQLGSDKAPVRLASLYALERLAQDNPSQRPTIVNVICAYLQMPYTSPGPAPVEPSVDDAGRSSKKRAEQEREQYEKLLQEHEKREQEQRVRMTAQQILQQHISRTADEKIRWHTDIDLSGANLTEAMLDGADLTKANLREANLTRAHLDGADLTQAHLDGADLIEANLREANLTRAHLDGADLTQARLGMADLTGARLGGAKLSLANFFRANLTQASLRKAKLIKAHLDEANLTGAHLDGADLTQAVLRKAVLVKADLTGLSGVTLFGHPLPGGANLTKAILSEANLTGANLSEANLTGANLSGAIWANGTYWPEGLRDTIKAASSASSNAENGSFRIRDGYGVPPSPTTGPAPNTA